ncbi:MAG: hypothetical protein ACJATL_000736 [Rickettsiales bacterium]|jgi:hypothetical protein
MMKILLLLSVLIIPSCGFHTIYSDNRISSQSKAYNEELASITVKVSRDKINQDLKNNLEDVLNPGNIEIDQKYIINISLNRSTGSSIITSTGSAGRQKVILAAKYRLRDFHSGELIATGDVVADDDFDVENKLFANYSAENAIASNLTLVIARNIRNMLINDIVNSYKVREIPEEKELVF